MSWIKILEFSSRVCDLHLHLNQKRRLLSAVGERTQLVAIANQISRLRHQGKLEGLMLNWTCTVRIL